MRCDRAGMRTQIKDTHTYLTKGTVSHFRIDAIRNALSLVLQAIKFVHIYF